MTHALILAVSTSNAPGGGGGMAGLAIVAAIALILGRNSDGSASN